MVESMRRDGDVDNVEGGVDRAVDVEQIRRDGEVDYVDCVVDRGIRWLST